MIADTIQNILLIILVIAIVLGIAAVPFTMGRIDGYRKGQIDALNGKLYYKLEKQADSEFRWIECQQVCDYEKGE